MPRGAAWTVLGVVLGIAGLLALYRSALETPFLNDDYLLLEQARTGPLATSFFDLGPLGNYLRPLSRQLYFGALAALAGGKPLVFHLVNFALFVAALALVADALRTFLGRAGVLAGVLYFALLPLQHVNLMWISCAQELMALTGVLGALALHRRDRVIPALACYAAACMSKEIALPLPLVLFAWDRWVRGLEPARSVRRAAPYAVIGVAWMTAVNAARAGHAGTPPLLWTPAAFLAGYAHLGQSVAGLEQPAGLVGALLSHGPSLVPLALLGALAFWYAPGARPAQAAGAATAAPAAGARAIVPIAMVWIFAFGLPTGPVSYSWSGYYYTLAAVGVALLVGAVFARGDRWTWLALSAGLLWWNAGATSVPGFSVAEDPWVWTSHLTPYYFERAAGLARTMSRQLEREIPAPQRGTRFFFATLPPWAGFQMGNGALIRALYRDTSLASHFYSQFSETTAAGWPCQFLYWDGRDIKPLYANSNDPFFQVGSDLMLLDHPSGAAHAFTRGLASGGNKMDHLYWLGWAELMQGDRARAEAAWIRFGAHDDSMLWAAQLRQAHNKLQDGDTLEARRSLITAIQWSIGRPEAHAVLGDLLLRAAPAHDAKYGLLELKVAAWLNPADWFARRELALGLARVRLEDGARRELESLLHDFPAMRADSTVMKEWKALEPRRAASTGGTS